MIGSEDFHIRQMTQRLTSSEMSTTIAEVDTPLPSIKVHTSNVEFRGARAATPEAKRPAYRASAAT